MSMIMSLLLGIVQCREVCLPGSAECADGDIRLCDNNGQWIKIGCAKSTECRVLKRSMACVDARGTLYSERSDEELEEKGTGRERDNIGAGKDNESEQWRSSKRRLSREPEGEQMRSREKSQERSQEQRPERTLGRFQRNTDELIKIKTVYVTKRLPSEEEDTRERVVYKTVTRGSPTEIKLEFTQPVGISPSAEYKPSNGGVLAAGGDAKPTFGAAGMNGTAGPSGSMEPNGLGANSSGPSTGAGSASSPAAGGAPSQMAGGASSPTSSSAQSPTPSSAPSPTPSSAPSPTPSSTPSPTPSSAPSSTTGSTPSPAPSGSGAGASAENSSASQSDAKGAGSSSTSASGNGSQSPGGGPITSKQAQDVLKQLNYNPKNDYLEAAIKAVNEKIKDKNEAAMLMAQLAHESGGFQYIEEIQCNKPGACKGMYGTGAPGKSYHGRGFIQLSWPDNYKAAGKGLGMGDSLYNNPDQVAKDPKLGTDVSIWFWKERVVTAPGVAGFTKFGATTKAINGALECNGSNQDKAKKRYQIYLAFAKAMGVTKPASESGCYN